MRKETLLRDVLPYIEIWTSIAITILLILSHRLWLFEKQHPEIFKKDDTTIDKQLLHQKSELRRQYNNKLMTSLFVIFIWIVGLLVICFGFDGAPIPIPGLCVLGLALCAFLYMILFTWYKIKI